jgi:predicted nucleotidyltransferase
LKLLLDEHLSPEIARQLRERDHHVTAVTERPDLRGRADRVRFAPLPDEQRALVTRTLADFRPLLAETVRRGGSTYGIVCLTPRFPLNRGGPPAHAPPSRIPPNSPWSIPSTIPDPGGLVGPHRTLAHTVDGLTELSTVPLDHRLRRTLEHLVDVLRAEFGDDLVSLWLYGSRARREEPRPDSDIDLLMVTKRGSDDDWRRAYRILYAVASEEGVSPVCFSLKVVDSDWVYERRAIKSFFIQEVDRDKVVLAGEP